MLVELPTEAEAYPFSTKLEVRINDCSGGIHLGNHVMVSYMNEAMIKLYQALGFQGPMIGSTSFIQRDMAITYRSEANYGDVVDIYVAIEAFEESQYTMIYRLYNPRNEREIAHIRGVFASFDYKERKKVAVPQELRDAYQALCDK